LKLKKVMVLLVAVLAIILGAILIDPSNPSSSVRTSESGSKSQTFVTIQTVSLTNSYRTIVPLTSAIIETTNLTSTSLVLSYSNTTVTLYKTNVLESSSVSSTVTTLTSSVYVFTTEVVYLTRAVTTSTTATATTTPTVTVTETTTTTCLLVC
jgi:hypothetical protein